MVLTAKDIAGPRDRGWLRYLRSDTFPTFWCAGCGNGVIMQALARSLAARGPAPEQVAVVTGIGCFGKADDYLTTHSLHGTHGRALGFATGIKAARPELVVIALMGDGDCATIGGNHLIHACRRDIGVLAVVSNNLNYGMTGGQFSATTPEGSITSTSPYGHVEPAFDLCALVQGAGASFVARGTCGQPALLRRLFDEALAHPGFAFVEVMTACPTHYGRANRQGDAPKMMRGIAEAYRGKTGVLFRRETAGFSSKYRALQTARKAADGRVGETR
ncbi:MAG: thiamine pyrophosphate-dependent enzyme [Bacillota bacterium]|nr:thiamine pyrophosphate-dependent enzyme [Bacillota bacterium]